MMKTAATAARRRLWRNVVLCGLLSLAMAGLSGCEFGTGQSEADICAFMERVAASTEKSLANRDIDLARDTWSDVSEQGLNATSQGAEDIGKAIGLVAGTYDDLVAYCQSGDEEKKAAFLTAFQREAQKLSQMIAEEGFDTAKLDERIKDICGQ